MWKSKCASCVLFWYVLNAKLGMFGFTASCNQHGVQPVFCFGFFFVWGEDLFIGSTAFSHSDLTLMMNLIGFFSRNYMYMIYTKRAGNV